jgi:transposase InsO family protein
VRGDSVSAPGYELAIELFAAAERPLAKLRSAEAEEYLVNLSRQISDVVSRDKSPQNGRNADRERKAQPNCNARIEALMFFLELSTRRVEVAGIATLANGLWMSQIARNISDSGEGLLTGKRYLIHDRDPLFTAEFVEILADSGVKSMRLPPRSPNLNAYAERFVRTIKESCLDRMILFGEDALRKSVQEFTAHYHLERNHQGLGNRLILPDSAHVGTTGEIRRRERLGGMLNYYYREAA